MHTNFSEWYRLAGIEPNGELLPKRWAAVEEFKPGASEIISLTRFFYRLGSPNADFLATFRASFQKTDPAFPMRDNDQELAVLAGAELIDVIERSKTSLADMAALSLVCASAQNLRPAPTVTDIPEIAVRYLAKRSVSRPSLDVENIKDESKTELFEALTQLGAPYDKLATELLILQHQLPVVFEETNMLWWLFSEFSRDLKQSWNKSSVPAAALMAGKELADLTCVIPGPVAAMAFLDRVIRCAKAKPPGTISIVTAINDVSLDWRRKYVTEDCPSALNDILPFRHGIRLSLASPENNAWVPAFKQETGILPNAEISPCHVAYQIFLESLLFRSWKELK